MYSLISKYICLSLTLCWRLRYSSQTSPFLTTYILTAEIDPFCLTEDDRIWTTTVVHNLVDHIGIEPTTSSLRTMRSPNWAIGPLGNNNRYIYIKNQLSIINRDINESFFFCSSTMMSWKGSLMFRWRFKFSRTI